MDGQAAVVRKVFACTPKQEFWTSPQIYGEIVRQGTASTSLKGVSRALRELADKGLVKVENGCYQQVGITDHTTKTSMKEEVAMATKCKKQDHPQQVKKKEPVRLMDMQPERSGAGGQKAEQQGGPEVRRTPLEILDDLSKKAGAFQEAAETAALEISEYIEEMEGKVAKFEQLKGILGSL